MVLAAPAAEERTAWVDALQREAPRFVARLAARGVGCCPWYQVPFDDAGEPSLAVCDLKHKVARRCALCPAACAARKSGPAFPL